MQSYIDLLPPTAVSHSLSLPLLSASANNLIIAKTSLLQVFSFKSVLPVEGVKSEGGRKLSRGERAQTTKLVLIGQYELSGTIIGLGRVKTVQSKSGGEALLVALKDAKLSLVEWDPDRFTLSTISIHYFEREDLQGPPWAPDLGECANILTVDPGSRCAALKFGLRNIAILPFHQAGDDLIMDDYDPDVNMDELKASKMTTKLANGNLAASQTPYMASFVLSLLVLDPNLTHPVHISFLYGYREPTFGVLSSRTAISSALLHERQDTLSYTVYTLDLEQRASTTLLSISGFPYDIHKIIPLPLPVGGALLIGFNELIHVDQSGKTNGIAVNDFAKQYSSFALPQQTSSNLRLDRCVVEPLGATNGEMLLILSSGELAVLGFKRDGRSVSGLSLRLVSNLDGGITLPAVSSCVSNVGRGRIFVGSEEGDSMILGWSRKSSKPKNQSLLTKTQVEDQVGASDIGEEDELDDEDDLYAGSKPEATSATELPMDEPDQVDSYHFRIHDTLESMAPLKDVILVGQQNFQISIESLQNTDLMVTTGRGRAAALRKLNRTLTPSIVTKHDLSDSHGVWSIYVAKTPPNEGADDIEADGAEQYDNVLITTQFKDADDPQSSIHAMKSGILEEIQESDFDSVGATIDVGIFMGGTRIIQVLKSEIRTYDPDFGLAQIVAIADENVDTDQKIISTNFSEPYILIIRDDASIMILRLEETGDLEEISKTDSLQNTKWISGSLYDDINDIFHLEADDESQEETDNVLMFLLTGEGGLKVYRLSNLGNPVFTADGLSFLPPFLSSEFTVRRSTARDTLTDILIAELGDKSVKSPHMILRSINEDITIYQPFQCHAEGDSNTSLRFSKLPTSYMPQITPEDYVDGERTERKQPLRAIHDIGGYSAVFISGSLPSLILKSASTLPQVIGLGPTGIRSLSATHNQICQRGFIYSDDSGNVATAQLPDDDDYSTGWVTRRIYSGEDIQAFDYHAETDRYILGISHKVDFKLPEDETHYEWTAENTSLLPQIDQGTVKMFDPSTSSVTDLYTLEPMEVVMCVKTMNLETSEVNSRRRSLVAVGTALIRGEDLPSQGRIYIFDIIDVVPEPDQPETGRKLKLIAKEEVKGAVTALSEVGTEGFLLVAQGQKCMVRGLKEDGTLMPVAFMDMQCYVSVAKELKGTGLCVMGDVVKGIWFAGYTEEPYQLRLFSKSSQSIEVMTAEFLPYTDQLYIVVVDAASDLHILQFDPEHPKSLTGHLLLHHSTFNTGHFPSSTILLPRHLTPYERLTSHPSTPITLNVSSSSPLNGHAAHQILSASHTGTLSLLTPLSQSQYRILSALQSFLISTLPHHLGCNPRAYRHVDGGSGTINVGGGFGFGGNVGMGGRGVLDGNLLRRWGELGSWKRSEGVGRVGGEDGEVGIRGLISGVTGAGLGIS